MKKIAVNLHNGGLQRFCRLTTVKDRIIVYIPIEINRIWF